MLHLDEIEYPDGIALLPQELARGLIELRLGICDDHRFSTLGRLQNQIAGNAAGLACAWGATDGEALIEPGIVWERDDLPVLHHSENIKIRLCRRGDVEVGLCFPLMKAAVP